MNAAPAEALLEAFRPGLSVYLQGGVGEPLALRALVENAPEALAAVRLSGVFIPGVNTFDYAALGARVTGYMLPSSLRGGFQQGRTAVAPLAYSQIAAAFASGPPFDLAILQVTAPDDRGLCSFGPCADFAPLVWPRAARRAAFVNPRLPRAADGPAMPLAAIDLAIAAEGPFVAPEEPAPSPLLAAIAARVAALVPDGAAVQSGIGGAPAAAIHALADHRGLVIRSGLVTPGYRRLHETGALAADARHVTGMSLGDEGFVGWAAARLSFADARVTHGAASLAQASRFTAINSALEVDLFGQANVEWRDGRLISGLGGASDFARAAMASPGGRAILALPSTARGGSRIVARLASPTVSLARNDTDVVVTEHGVADLRGLDLDTRAAALIAIAAPEHRDALAASWEMMRRKM